MLTDSLVLWFCGVGGGGGCGGARGSTNVSVGGGGAGLPAERWGGTGGSVALLEVCASIGLVIV